MKNQQLVSIPVVSLSSSRERWEPGSEWGEKIFNSENYIKISTPVELPELSYAIKMNDVSLSSYFGFDSIAIFSQKDSPALDNIYAVSVKGEFPFWATLLKSEGGGKGRKTFMTPTPLHIPKSKTSPIADSLHEVQIFKMLVGSQRTRLIQKNTISWKHPLIFIQKQK